MIRNQMNNNIKLMSIGVGACSIICGAVLAYGQSPAWGWFLGSGVIIILGVLGIESKDKHG
jgi:hypothetical protein